MAHTNSNNNGCVLYWKTEQNRAVLFMCVSLLWPKGQSMYAGMDSCYAELMRHDEVQISQTGTHARISATDEERLVAARWIDDDDDRQSRFLPSTTALTMRR